MSKKEIILSLSPLEMAYIEALLWASMDESDENGGDPMDKNYGVEDLSLNALNQIKHDIRTFINAAGGQDWLSTLDRKWQEQAGHDLFLTREHHGAGFFDGDWPEDEGERLTVLAHKLGESSPYISDSGKVEVM